MKIRALAVLLVFTAAGALRAGTPEAVVETAAPKGDALLDKIWSIPKLYRDDHNSVIEEFDLIGRFQEDYYNVDSNRGSTSFFEIRRFRLGVDAFFAERHIEVEAEVDTALRAYHSPSIFYNRMTNLWVRFQASEEFGLRVGKFQPHVGYDREFSNNYLKTFERGFFDDQLIGTTDYITGAEVSGKFGHFGYLAAVYSTDVDKEFGQFDGGQAYQAEINYDFSKPWNAKKALWVLDYLHADGKNENTNVFTNYRNVLVTYLDLEKGRFSLVPQFAYGEQVAGKGDVYSLQLMPGYMITDKLEFFVRYQLGLASESNGISTLNRQQKTVGVFTGDTYNACYLGLNYYVYGHRLKLMFAEEYARLSGGTGPSAGYSGWTTLVGLRLFF
ncbi:phosphate-selective porin O and P [Chthoniobacter flavus Ellin428]|uniref:Phosphate-selective porin O and P n=1 Tax=Chthoniobacter flavus Ellin428 TaxID=497964 RepID=B4D084_9BACT|nr:phosphate porin [Chthoniobacter flavus]EDY20398.1 phosphate-selective porin O and P [Chthoniobacter flavus Ellin428]TCO94287.1 phosphate-selective porin O/P [Chthoniobacter flavus]